MDHMCYREIGLERDGLERHKELFELPISLECTMKLCQLS